MAETIPSFLDTAVYIRRRLAVLNKAADLLSYITKAKHLRTSVVHEPARDKPGGKLESARLGRGVGSDCGEISGPGSNGSSRLEPVRAK